MKVPLLGHLSRHFSLPRTSIREYLVLVILLATVPLAALCAVLLFHEIDRSRDQLEQGLQRAAGTVALGVERELGASIDALTLLAHSESLRRGDLLAFHGALAQMPALRPAWSSAELADVDGKVLVASNQAYGEPLGNIAGQAGFEEAKTAGHAVVGGLIVDGQGAQRTGVHVPVHIDGRLRYVLTAWIAPAGWQRLLTQGSAVDESFALLLDAQRRVLASSAPVSGFDNERALPLVRRAIAESPAGVEHLDVPQAESAYLAWKEVPIGGWTLALGLSASPIDKARATAIGGIVAAGALSLAIGLLAAMLVARRVTRPLSQLARAGPQALQGDIEVDEIRLLKESLETAEAQRQAATESLRRTAEELQTLFESSPIGLAIARDRECKTVIGNPALRAMFDGAPGRLWGTALVRGDGSELDAAEQPLQRAAGLGETVHDMELEVHREDGRTLKLLAHAVPLLGADGQPHGAIAGFVDISERARAESRFALAERKLRESRHLVELAQQAGHVGFFDYHFADDAVAWSSGLAKLFGIDLANFEGTWAAWMQRIDPEDVAKINASIEAAVARGDDDARFEFRARRPGNTVRWLEGRVVFSYDAAGKPIHMIGVTVDVTERQLAERERAQLVERAQEARREAESANRAKDEFLATLGHELRNPLGAIAAASEVLNRSVDSQTLASARRIISRQTQHMARLMDDLLDVARVVAGKIALARRPLNLTETVQRVLASLEVADRLKAHHVVQRQMDEVWVDGDSTRLEQVVNNLVTNALKYTPAGGTITLSVRRDEGFAVFEVQDTGVGMPPMLVPKVFELFVQAERTKDRRQGGLGVGLTLVRRLVELHGGTATGHSAGPQMGSTFTVRLPAIAAPSQTSRPRDDRVSCQPLRVVVVEDNDDALEGLKVMLELDGHEVKVAADGHEGLRVLLETRPDIALLDIGLPGLSGLQVAEQARAAGLRSRLVALSGYGQPDDLDRTRAAGFDAHLVKPVDPAALRAQLALARDSGERQEDTPQEQPAKA